MIYYERQLGECRVKLSTRSSDWDTAASFRDRHEAREGIACSAAAFDSPMFSDFAERYLAEDPAHLAPTTKRDRALYLKPEGAIVRLLGRHRLDAVSPALLRDWWNAEVIGRKGRTGKPLTVATGRWLAHDRCALGAQGLSSDIRI